MDSKSKQQTKVTKSDINKFKSLYIRHFNQELSDDEARTELTLLIRQVEAIYQPVTVAQFDKYIRRAASKERGNGTFA